jgi:ABC-type polysaccharide/polyol phosphate export permease
MGAPGISWVFCEPGGSVLTNLEIWKFIFEFKMGSPYFYLYATTTILILNYFQNHKMEVRVLATISNYNCFVSE